MVQGFEFRVGIQESEFRTQGSVSGFLCGRLEGLTASTGEGGLDLRA